MPYQIIRVAVGLERGPLSLNASVVYWLEFLTADTEVQGSIPGATRLSEWQCVWDGVHTD